MTVTESTRVKSGWKRGFSSDKFVSTSFKVIPAGVTGLVLSWLVHFMLYYPLIMRHACGVRLVHERSETTLPWSTACDSGTRPRIHYSGREKEKTTVTRLHWDLFLNRFIHHHFFRLTCLTFSCTITMNLFITFPKPSYHIPHIPILKSSWSRLCVLSACNLSRKGGHQTRPRANLWSVSAEHGDLSASEDPFDLSTDVPEVAEAGTDVSTPVKPADTANFL